MIQVCPRCQRANPSIAVYCHYDGGVLRPDAAGSSRTFPREFVFPSGRRCRTFDDLVGGIYYEWEDSLQLLRDGTFARFLASIGRADLASLIRQSQVDAAVDIALTHFVQALPAPQVQGPKLGLNPRRLIVGPARVGEQRSITLHVSNEGRGILQGRVTVEPGTTWLKFPHGADAASFPVHAPREQSLIVLVDSTGLVVGQQYASKLVVITNGGIAEIPIRLELTARPFAHAPYQGATTPRELARKMRDQPHPAVPLLQAGEVERWFISNGWTYPIVGEPAKGLAVVQQFFEELGLASVPEIHLAQKEFSLSCRPPEVLKEQFVIRSPARRLVYARATCDAPWLRIATPNVSGQVQAAIEFTIDSSLMPEDRVWETTLRVVANAGQSFQVRVRVEVQGNTQSWFRSPRTRSAPRAKPTTTKPTPSGLLPPVPAPAKPTAFGTMILTGMLLVGLVRLVLVVPADVLARWLNPEMTASGWFDLPEANAGYLRRLAVCFSFVGAFAGVWLVRRRGGRWTDSAAGLFAGAIAGVAAGATLGCLLVVGDAPARLVLEASSVLQHLPSILAILLWIAAVSLNWALLGATFAVFLYALGERGRELLRQLASPLRWLFGRFAQGEAFSSS